MRKQAVAMIFALTAALTPTPSQALAGECRVRRAVPDVDSTSCTLLAATEIGFVTGATHSLPVYDPPEIPPGSDDSVASSIGATLTGPGVDLSWEIGKTVAEPIQLTAGAEYTLTVFEVGSFSVVSGAGPDSADGAQARHTAQPDVVMAVDPYNPERRTTCRFEISRPIAQGAKIIFSGDLTCSDP